ncbi:MAG: methyltransferase domain-containing protein [Thermoplasmata archaeon]|nr:methyltransferase domain-containing protein [Thermoplasmata archaeon]MCI4341189.1 methyltransferase domain-containing protein [Thermoplasmata archaeon]
MPPPAADSNAQGSAQPADGRSLDLLLATGTVPLGFCREGSSVFLIARERAARWPIELLRQQSGRLRWAGGDGEGLAELVTAPDEQARILQLFVAKYGDEGFRRWYEHPARILRVQLAVRPPGNDSDRYYRWLRSEFDNIAEDYDRHITGNRMNFLLRNRSLARLRPLFAGRDPLLEIGCGSGMETLPLLESGHEVTAVDISERMLEVVRAKARERGCTERLRTIRARARDLSSLVSQLGQGSFAGAYSTYGALNCEPELRPVGEALAALLAPGAPLFVGVYNRWCLFEVLGYTLTLQLDRALGRKTNPVPVGGSRFCVDVYAFSPRDVDAALGPYFRRRAIEGVPVLLPPSDLTSYAERFSRRFDTLARWDARVGNVWPFQQLGDHFLATYERERVEAPGPHSEAVAELRPASFTSQSDPSLSAGSLRT